MENLLRRKCRKYHSRHKFLLKHDGLFSQIFGIFDIEEHLGSSVDSTCLKEFSFNTFMHMA